MSEAYDGATDMFGEPSELCPHKYLSTNVLHDADIAASA